MQISFLTMGTPLLLFRLWGERCGWPGIRLLPRHRANHSPSPNRRLSGNCHHVVIWFAEERMQPAGLHRPGADVRRAARNPGGKPRTLIRPDGGGGLRIRRACRVRFSRGRIEGKKHPEHRAESLLAAYPDLSMMLVHNPLGHPQSKARSRLPFGRHEWME